MYVAVAKRAGNLPSDRAKERRTKNADPEQAAKESHRFIALTALPLPVNIAQVQPEGKLIQRKCRCNTVEHGSNSSRPPPRLLRARPYFEQPAIADQKEKQNSPNQMMDMPAVHGYVMKRSDIVMDCDRDATHYDDRYEKAYRSQEQPLASRLTELAFVDLAQMRSRHDRRENDQDAGDKERPDPETAMNPWHRNTL